MISKYCYLNKFQNSNQWNLQQVSIMQKISTPFRSFFPDSGFFFFLYFLFLESILKIYKDPTFLQGEGQGKFI